MSADPLILCENLVKVYTLEAHDGSGTSEEVHALQGLDLAISTGEMIGIVGTSGSGKSTLLNVLGGLDRLTAGRALVAGRDLGKLSPAALDRYRRETVGFVWQHGARNLIPYLTAEENIEVPLTLSGQGGDLARQRALELLEMVDLSNRVGHRMEELSGGEQQRVAVAIALSNRPTLLLADEPTGELDTATAQTIYDLLRHLNKSLGLTIVIVSHDSGIAKHVDRVVAVRDGKLASETLRVKKSASEAEEEHHLEELAVLDSAGRLQLPREALERFNIRRRVRVEITDDAIIIRPPENDHQGSEHIALSHKPTGETESLPPAAANLLGRVKTWLGKTGRR